jgi:ABC-2 type transport system permease protein/oleandomycin transport system permease protein
VDLGRNRVGDQEPRVRPSGQLHLDLPLTFASGAFVGIALMPGWLQVWARNNPVTIWSNTIRAYTIGGRLSAYVGETVLGLTIKSGIWIAIILAIFMPLSVRIYRRT